MGKSPAFSFYPDKWLAGTMHLRPRAYQAYHKVLCWMWLHSDDKCSIPNNVQAICFASGIAKRSYKTIWEDQVMNSNMPLLKIEDNRLLSEGLRKEAAKQAHNSEVRRQAAFASHKHIRKPANAVPSDSGSDSGSDCKKPKDNTFGVFWTAYPKKKGKTAAEKAWRNTKDKPPIEDILKAIELQAASEQWKKEGGQFIPYPQKWINQGRWDDELTVIGDDEEWLKYFCPACKEGLEDGSMDKCKHCGWVRGKE